MTDREVQIYLSGPLNQELCKDTLRAVLESRVATLRRLDVPDRTIITCLENLVEAYGFGNADVLEDVIEQVVITSSADYRH